MKSAPVFPLLTFFISFASAEAGITRTDVSNQIGFRIWDEADSRATSGSLWIPTASEITSESKTFYDNYLARTTRHYANWGQAFGAAALESRKTATRAGGSNFVTSLTTSVSFSVSDDLFFTRPTDPENDTAIPVTLYYDVDYFLPPTGFEKFGHTHVGDTSGRPGNVTVSGLQSSLNAGEDLIRSEFEYSNNLQDPVVTNGLDIQSISFFAQPGEEITLGYRLVVEHAVGYSLADPDVGDSLNVGGGVSGGIRLWLEVGDDVDLATDSGHDYRIEPAAIETLDELWAGYRIVDDAWIDTGNLLGWLLIQDAPWVWSLTLESWFYLPEENLLRSDGFWTYLLR
jgi:hypothetical protein